MNVDGKNGAVQRYRTVQTLRRNRAQKTHTLVLLYIIATIATSCKNCGKIKIINKKERSFLYKMRKAKNAPPMRKIRFIARKTALTAKVKLFTITSKTGL